MTSIAEAPVAQLSKHGVDCVFGIPGVHTIGLYRGLVEKFGAPVVRTVTARGIMFDHPFGVPASPNLQEVRDLIAQSDIVPAFGTEFGPTDHDIHATGTKARMNALIRADLCPERLSRHPAARSTRRSVHPARVDVRRGREPADLFHDLEPDPARFFGRAQSCGMPFWRCAPDPAAGADTLRLAAATGGPTLIEIRADNQSRAR